MPIALCLAIGLWSCRTRPPDTSGGPTAALPSRSARAHPSPPPLPVDSGSTRQSDPSPGSLAYLDFKNGFRDVKFGDPPTKDMVLIEDSGESKFYSRAGESYVMGQADVEHIRYGFYKHRLYAVIVRTNGYSNSRLLLEVLRQAYGPGRPNPFMNGYSWHGSLVGLSYEEHSKTHNAAIVFFSVSLANEKEAEAQAKTKKGVSGL